MSKQKGMDLSHKVAVIGAGPSGLSMVRNLQKFGIPVDGFEKHKTVGGLWDIENPHSTIYESAHLISSKSKTEFTEFPMEDSVPDYPSHRELKKYFQSFANTFQLNTYYRFGAEVKEVSPWEDLWKLRLKSGEEFVYKAVVAANGNLHTPNIPKFSGKFTGKILHSSHYKNPDIFRNKRVLVVGGGNSGCDIAVDAVHYAKKVDLSLRRGYHFVPKYIFGIPADTIGGKITLPAFLKQSLDGFLLRLFTGDPSRLGFPKPDHKLYESHPVVNSLVLHYAGHGDITVRPDLSRWEGRKVRFVDGTSEEYDLVLLATGYKLSYPFFSDKVLDWKNGIPDFYLNTFSRVYPGLILAGMIEAAGIGWQGRYEQAECIAAYLKEFFLGSERFQKFREKCKNHRPNLSGGYSYLNLDRMAYYVHNLTFRKIIRKETRDLIGKK
jgi:hypothetical protein